MSEIDTSATPFVPICALIAAFSGTDVEIIPDVDPSALRAARESVAYFSEHFSLEPGELIVASRDVIDKQQTKRREQDCGLFFTRGVDSSASLIARRDSVSRLLGVDWVDPPYADDGQHAIWKGTERAADALELPLLRLSTNARDTLDPLISWSHSHGLVLVALALLVAPICPVVLLSGAHRRETAPSDFGNAPQLIGYWSSERWGVTPFDAADGRTQKSALVAQDATLLNNLLVCWESPGDRNCGKCLKCLQTMSHFMAAGHLDAVAHRFEQALLPSMVAALDTRGVDHATIAVLRELLVDLPPSALRAAWHRAIMA